MKVLLISGLGCDASIWQAQLEVLQPYYDCEVVSCHLTATSFKQMASRILQHYPEKLVIIGHSMGGALGLEIWRQQPAQVHGLALLASSTQAASDNIKRLKLNTLNNVSSNELLTLMHQQSRCAIHQAEQKTQIVQQYIKSVTNLGVATLIRQNLALLQHHNRSCELNQINCPTLILCGKQDRLTPVKHSILISQNVKNSWFYLIDNCGHLPSLEQPLITNQLLLTWLARINPNRDKKI